MKSAFKYLILASAHLFVRLSMAQLNFSGFAGSDCSEGPIAQFGQPIYIAGSQITIEFTGKLPSTDSLTLVLGMRERGPGYNLFSPELNDALETVRYEAEDDEKSVQWGQKEAEQLWILTLPDSKTRYEITAYLSHIDGQIFGDEVVATIVPPCSGADSLQVIGSRLIVAEKAERYEAVIAMADSLIKAEWVWSPGYSYMRNAAYRLGDYRRLLRYLDAEFAATGRLYMSRGTDKRSQEEEYLQTRQRILRAIEDQRNSE